MLTFMVLGPIKRRIVSNSDIRAAAKRIKLQLEKFRPNTVVYLKDGGKNLGQSVAHELSIPAIGLDIAYPLSRTLNSSPNFIMALAWPMKELVYKLRAPKLGAISSELLSQQRIVLVDDSASSGRTLEVALRALKSAGIERDDVKVVVYRCGTKAKSLVNYFETDEPVLFDGR